MVVVTREPPSTSAGQASLGELERLWAVSPDAEGARPSASSGRQRRAYRALVRALTVAWPAVLVAVFVFAPAPTPDVSYPAWVVGASLAVLLGPLVAGLLGVKGLPTAALVTSFALAGLGIAVGVACRATAHHTGGWWIAETAAFAALAGISLACLAARRS
jgi:hypothetical protein